MLKSTLGQSGFDNGDLEDKKIQADGGKGRDNSNVFHIYSSPEDFKNAGIFNGGLDIGVDPTQLSVNFNSEENLVERMKSPFSQIPLNLGPNAPNGNFYDQSHSAPQGFGMVNELNSKMHLEQHDEGIQSTFSATLSPQIQQNECFV